MDSKLFERVARHFAAAAVGAASESSHATQEIPSEEQAERVLLGALQRLRADPSLFSGDKDLVFTYEDPILASAALFAGMGYDNFERIVRPAAGSGYKLRNAALWDWALVGVRAWLSRGNQAEYELGARTPDKPFVLDRDPLRIAVVGDAGYCGNPQTKVIRSILKIHGLRAFDLVIHLGDVYFAGGDAAMLENLLAPFGAVTTAGPRLFTLCGNHDLYYGPEGYRHALKVLGQPGRYFLIETPSWRIACLDTSLAAERILRNCGKLDEKQLEWLEEILREPTQKPLILMSHHFLISAWEAPPQELYNQLSDIVRDRVFAWYWGHEHRSVTYDQGEDGYYGACVGNGAFLEKWSTPPRKSPLKPTWYPKNRCSCFRDRSDTFWPHGFLELELNAQSILERFHVERNDVHERRLPVPNAEGAAP